MYTTKLLCMMGMLCACSSLAVAQEKSSWLSTVNDTAYVEDLSRQLTVRLFESHKYGYFSVFDKDSHKRLTYLSHTPYNFGIGANYRSIGINLGFNFPFINNGSKEKYGKPKYLDLQTHVYLRKWLVDAYLQFYRGYYLTDPEGTLNNYKEDGLHARRPDLKSTSGGLNVTYVFNDERFSYRANTIQVDYQKKSAGSFLVGASGMYVNMRGDSAIVPANTKDDFMNGLQYDRANTFQLTVSAGYGYTVVIAKHFFITGVVTLGAGANTNSTRMMADNNREHGYGFAWNNMLRLGVGYNSTRYFAGLHWENFDTHNGISSTNAYEGYGTGNLRVSLARRFNVKRLNGRSHKE
ncbi:protein of unknown function [Chitinophaga costaii]|uniref:DUF4421 domain-containing protein n=1 Tax=Chitinophaga costaii TaxID=1335309 RepID=A0A1C3Z688_9BACT|nr:DUF4421 domain-containing protein [Chitinophaga costaii]PUZ30248.1 DUF4421 domain-containing protein [Chitinophaga costaii]SCB77901.1 protein of unknown function [Chitinophaga costaii]